MSHVHETTTTMGHIHDMMNTTTAHMHGEMTTMDHSGHTIGDDMMMIMYFHGGYKDTILFEFWQCKNAGLFVLSCIILFVIAALYEGLKVFRETLIQKELSRISSMESKDAIELAKRSRLLTSSHIIQTLLHLLQVTIGYSLMLVVMTYNTWLFFCIILGYGTGYFIFGHRRLTTIDNNECCH